jgi:transitional endoplasmic reticulum ATPase
MPSESDSLKFKVTEAMSKDVGRAFARLDPKDIKALSAQIGDIVALVGKKTTVAKLMPAYQELRGQQRIQLDGITRENAGVGLDESIQVCKIMA